jgi:hypothetical protein
VGRPENQTSSPTQHTAPTAKAAIDNPVANKISNSVTTKGIGPCGKVTVERDKSYTIAQGRKSSGAPESPSERPALMVVGQRSWA